MKLTEKQKRFCEEYLTDLNAAQAAIRSGYSEDTAKEQASRLLTNVNVQAYVAELQEIRSKKVECTSEMVLKELMKLGFSNVSDLKNNWEEFKSWDEIPEEKKHIIQEVETITSKNKEGTETTRLKVKLHSKTDALEKIAKHIGFYEKDNKQKEGGVTIVQLPSNER